MIFVDTSTVFALASARDMKHREARRLFDALFRIVVGRAAVASSRMYGQSSRPRRKLAFRNISSIVSVGSDASTSARRARQSRLLIWSARTTPRTDRPGGNATSKGYPFTRLVIGHRSAKPTVRL